jgi:hemerythrin
MQNDANYRCDTEHLIAEHRRLHRLMTQAHAAIVEYNGPDQEATTADVVHVLRQVREELARHFAKEEADGFLKNAASCSPELAAEARRIEDEHPRLLESADALIAQAMDSDQSVQKQVALELAFDELRHHLDSHETAENALLRQSVGIGVVSRSDIIRALDLEHQAAKRT